MGCARRSAPLFRRSAGAASFRTVVLSLRGPLRRGGDVVDIVIECDAVLAQVEVLGRREVAGGDVSHIFQFLAGGYFVVRHKLVQRRSVSCSL